MDDPIRFMAPRLLRLLATIGFAIFALANAAAESVATVNGVDIDSATFEFYMASRTMNKAAQVSQAEREIVLQELIDIYLLTTQPRATEIAATTRVKAQIELQSRGVLAQAVVTDYMAKHPATDAQIRAEYTIQAELSPSLQFKARHILVETQGAAIDLISRLDDGADFAELAKANSTGPSGPAGGDLGWFGPDQMVKPFADAVALLADGAYTRAPVQTEFGWHIILREESRTSEPPTLESVRDVIKQRVEQANFQRYLEDLRKNQSG
ncbi:MAG: peptidylprolyl isomerase [Proteobacteria bacterium]|nr:peptidylprolyl isomerase [Pseudomonadota bacterium]